MVQIEKSRKKSPIELEADTATVELGDNNSSSSETQATSSGCQKLGRVETLFDNDFSAWDSEKEIGKYITSLSSFAGKFVIQWMMHFSSKSNLDYLLGS